MKTVQEWIRETDIEELANTHFCEYTIKYERYITYKKTVAEIKHVSLKRFYEFTEQLKSIEPKGLSNDEK